jgi:hypothetical protein
VTRMPRRHFDLPLNFNGPAANTRFCTAARLQSLPFFSPVNHPLSDPPTMEGDHDPPPPASHCHHLRHKFTVYTILTRIHPLVPALRLISMYVIVMDLYIIMCHYDVKMKEHFNINIVFSKRFVIVI